MLQDLATAIAVKVLDTYYPKGNYSTAELSELTELISGVIKDKQGKNNYNAQDFLD